ncbi:hypothetical protein BH24ACT26_BH24ACT26_16110 [soil metagenome]
MNIDERDGRRPGPSALEDGHEPEASEDPGRGPPRSALDVKRRRIRRGRALVVAALLLAIGLVLSYIVVIVTNANLSRAPEPAETIAVDQPSQPMSSTLIFGTTEEGPGTEREVVWMTLVTLDASSDGGAVIYIPAHTAAEVPGRGLQPVGDALASGGIPLLLVSAENLLDVSIDHYLELSDRDARALFEATGPLAVDVPAEVRVHVGPDQARLILAQGLQRLSADLLVQLLYVAGIDGDDAELGSRHLAFWQSFFESFHDDPEALARALKTAGGSLSEADASPEDIAGMLRSLAGLPAGDRSLGVLPVEQVGAGGQELYEVNEEESSALLEALIGPVTTPEVEVRVQVLNGNGVPGIGEEVGKELVDHGFRVVLSGNARHLGYEKTLIIAYDSTPDALDAAQRARDLLGVGEVQVSGQSQGIVDLTLVVGKDFLRVDR